MGARPSVMWCVLLGAVGGRILVRGESVVAGGSRKAGQGQWVVMQNVQAKTVDVIEVNSKVLRNITNVKPRVVLIMLTPVRNGIVDVKSLVWVVVVSVSGTCGFVGKHVCGRSRCCRFIR